MAARAVLTLPRAKTIALFPGSFKPPHAGHLRGLAALVDRADIDEVVVVISARMRRIPGTTLALDAHVALEAFEALVGRDARVRFEICDDTAVQHALRYLDHVPPGTTVLLCMGSEDLGRDDERFAAALLKCRTKRVRADICALPTADIGTRATDLRAAIAAGEAGRAAFFAGLPANLPEWRKAAAWRACRSGVREVSDIFTQRLEPLFDEYGLDRTIGLRPIDAVSAPAFAAALADRRSVELRTAVDELEATTGNVGRGFEPRYRFAVAKRALGFLSRQRANPAELPVLVAYDRGSRTLIERPPLPAGRTLADELAAGQADAATAARVGLWLAWLHALPVPENPLRGTWEREREWWAAHVRAVSGTCESLASELGRNCEHRNVHYGLTPRVVRVHERKLAITRFESMASFGDPAIDLLIFATAYRDAHRGDTAAAESALARFFAAYAEASTAHAAWCNRARDWLDRGVRFDRTR